MQFSNGTKYRFYTLALVIAASTLLAPLAQAYPYKMSAEEFEALSPNDQTDFPYVNPRDSATACGLPLTAKEELAQQAKADPGAFRLLGHSLLTANDHGVARTLLTRPLIDEHLRKILAIRDQTRELEKKNFPHPRSTGANDEADAYRHFTFATLLTLHLGERVAREVLTAHEWYQRNIDTMMDRFNNAASLKIAATHLNEWKHLNEADLESTILNTAEQMIASGELVVLQPRFSGTPHPSTAFYKFSRDLLREPLD